MDAILNHGMYLEYDIEQLKLQQMFESAFSEFKIRIAEDLIINSDYYTESEYISYYENAVSNLGNKVVELIKKLIEMITNFIGKIKESISKLFSPDIEDIMEDLGRADIPDGDKVIIYDIEKNRKLIDLYIQEMAKLERKLMALKYDKIKNGGPALEGEYDREYDKILKEMDNLNRKFDKSLLDEHDFLIKMSLKDAIRFNDKDLNNIRVNYNAIKKQSKECLSLFKKDANGCDVPVKLNIIQKMSNHIATRSRKSCERMLNYHHKNLDAMLKDERSKAALAKVGKVFNGIKNGAAVIVKHPIVTAAAVYGTGKLMSKNPTLKKNIVDPVTKKVVDPAKNAAATTAKKVVVEPIKKQAGKVKETGKTAVKDVVDAAIQSKAGDAARAIRSKIPFGKKK